MIHTRPSRSHGQSGSHWSRRLELQRHRRRSQKYFVILLVLVPFLLLLLIELGRAMLAAQDMRLFISTIDEMPADEVKRECSRFAGMLGDRNPFVRSSAMAALKVATGWRLGDDPREWSRWWREHEPTWDYRPAQPRFQDPTGPDWRSLLPAEATSAPPVEAP